MAEDTGPRIRALRRAAGLTQSELAEKADVSVRTIRRYERGTHKPDTYSLTKLAGALDTSVDYLLCLTAGQGKTLKAFTDRKRRRPVFREKERYYWIFFTPGGHGSCQQRVGTTMDGRGIFEPKPIDPRETYHLCQALFETPMVLETEEDVALFRVYGGEAIASETVCEKFLEECMAPQVEPTEDTMRGKRVRALAGLRFFFCR